MAVPIDRAVGVGAAGASAAPAPVYGEYLTTHGLGLLSYAEWIQVIGAVYVATLLARMFCGWIGRRVKR
jgi:polyferredoxin